MESSGQNHHEWLIHQNNPSKRHPDHEAKVGWENGTKIPCILNQAPEAAVLSMPALSASKVIHNSCE